MQSGAGGVELEIKHEEHDGRGAFFVPGGASGRLAELVYACSSGQAAVIEHTEVSSTLAGQGVGKRLVEAAVAWARGTGTRFVPLCPFARTVFDRNPGLRDVLK
jgi:predicted GNAT family acetyltransferase